MIATSGYLAALECSKFVFDRGSAPRPHWGSLQRSPDPLACLRSPNSKVGEEGEEKGREEGGEEGKGKYRPPFANFWICP